MLGSGGLFSFVPRVQDAARLQTFTQALQIYQLGVSWGGFESLCVLLEMQPMDWSEKKWMVRLFNGLEHADDLIADLEQAAKVAGF